MVDSQPGRGKRCSDFPRMPSMVGEDPSLLKRIAATARCSPRDV